MPFVPLLRAVVLSFPEVMTVPSVSGTSSLESRSGSLWVTPRKVSSSRDAAGADIDCSNSVQRCP